MFITLTNGGDSSSERDAGADTRIAACLGPDAAWARGRHTAVCTPDPGRLDVDVSTTDEGFVAVFGDAYLDDEPLDATAFRALDGAYDRINGEFAGIVETDDGVHVVTDRLNLRQLFVYRGESHFVASSSVRAVLAYLDHVDRLDTLSVNRTALTEFLDIGYFVDTKTHFEGIELLPAATRLDVTRGEETLDYDEEVYWEYGYGNYFSTRAEAAEALAAAIRDAVALRIRPGLRMGLHLSGGMDSRLILAAVPRDADLTVYSFGVPYNDEAAIARIAARVTGNPVERIYLTNELAGYAPQAVELTDGHTSIRHFHHLPTMESMVGACDKLFLGTAGETFLGGAKLCAKMFDESFDGEDLYEKTSTFDSDLWASVFGPAGYFEQARSQQSMAESFGRTDADNHANRNDSWTLRNRQGRFVYQAGPRSVNHFLPVSNPFADSRVVEAWCRFPPRMRFEGDLRVDALRVLNPTLALVPLGGTWAPPVAPQLRYVLGAPRALIGSRAIRSRLPGNWLADPFGYPDYAEWLRSDGPTAEFVSTTLASFASRGWADADQLAGAYDAHRRGDTDYMEELCIIISLELWLQQVAEAYPTLVGEYASESAPVSGARDDDRSHQAHTVSS